MKATLAAISLAWCAPALACPTAGEAEQAQLPGVWHAQVEGAEAVVLTLAKHPEYAQSVRGFLARSGRRVEVAGDEVDGEFTLEESQDGVRISATWLGDVVEGSCGREIRGTWKAEGAPLEHPFVLRKQP